MLVHEHALRVTYLHRYCLVILLLLFSCIGKKVFVPLSTDTEENRQIIEQGRQELERLRVSYCANENM